MPNCFIIMPFRPELHYMYLFVKQHIENTFDGVLCKRGDEKILTVPLLDKVVSYIQEADVVIADCTGRNPNVFYELGIAHTLKKDVILITNDPIDEAPSDIRAFEFIRYELDDHVGFLEKLDRALRAVLGNPLDILYDKASSLFDTFCNETHLQISRATKEEFITVVAAPVRRLGSRLSSDEKALTRILLEHIVESPVELSVRVEIDKWIEQKFPDP
jgi:hypothetical protein